MKSLMLLVDFENVKDVKLANLPPQAQVRIFVGKSQNNIPFSMTSEAQPLGDRLRWIKIDGDGKNNLDFHLAYYLGRLAHEFQETNFVILSRDKGFDALVDHVTKVGLVRCRRIDSLEELPAPKPKAAKTAKAVETAKAPVSHFERVYAILSKTDKRSRPRRRKTITQSISATFQKKLPPKEVEALVELFFSKGLITETRNVLSYHF